MQPGERAGAYVQTPHRRRRKSSSSPNPLHRLYEWPLTAALRAAWQWAMYGVSMIQHPHVPLKRTRCSHAALRDGRAVRWGAVAWRCAPRRMGTPPGGAGSWRGSRCAGGCDGGARGGMGWHGLEQGGAGGGRRQGMCEDGRMQGEATAGAGCAWGGGWVSTHYFLAQVIGLEQGHSRTRSLCWRKQLQLASGLTPLLQLHPNIVGGQGAVPNLQARTCWAAGARQSSFSVT